jgi:hypothetical protein
MVKHGAGMVKHGAGMVKHGAGMVKHGAGMHSSTVSQEAAVPCTLTLLVACSVLPSMIWHTSPASTRCRDLIACSISSALLLLVYTSFQQPSRCSRSCRDTAAGQAQTWLSRTGSDMAQQDRLRYGFSPMVPDSQVVGRACHITTSNSQNGTSRMYETRLQGSSLWCRNEHT